MEGFRGLSPSSSSSPNLLCQEDKSCLMEKSKSPQITEELEFPCFDLQMEADYVKLMVEKETRVRFGSTERPSWLKDARLDSVNWILNAQTLLGFRNQTAYLSITFLDLFLSIRVIEEDKLWAVRLLAIACLTLAGKMEEPTMPPLSGIPLTKEDSNLFDFAVIQRMELLVLNTFGWKMGLITPFVYINYLVSKLGDHSDKLDQLISKAFELVMAIVKEINLMDHRPSVIAAAAVLAAVDWRLTREALKLKISTVSLWETLENQEEELYSCYSLMQRLATKDDLTSTPRLTEVDHTLISTTTTTGTSTSTTNVVGAKRKLAFRDCDPKT